MPEREHRMKPPRNTDSVPGEWYIDTACINCGASRHVAPELIVERNDKSVFVRQPITPEEQLAVWRAVFVCPTASVRSETKQPRPNAAIFPQQITSGVWRCGFNARSSFGAHSYFAARPDGNLLIDSPRYAAELVKWFDDAGGIAHILLSHRDDVADADKYARQFGARVWIHREDRSAAPYATDLIDDGSVPSIAAGVRAIPLPGHTRVASHTCSMIACSSQVIRLPGAHASGTSSRSGTRAGIHGRNSPNRLASWPRIVSNGCFLVTVGSRTCRPGK